MQLCTVYRCSKKLDTYLYVEKTNDFTKVPEPLRKLLGTLSLVMTFDLDRREHLGGADLKKVKSELTEKGFYLQLPPPEDNLLDEHKKQVGHQD